MANKKDKDKEFQTTISSKGMESIEEAVKPIVFTDVSITDAFCDYTYRIKIGIGAGNSHNVKGSIVVHEDLSNAMEKLDKHMACIDLAFKLSGTEFDDIEQVENNELTAMYAVTAFSLTGGEDNLSVVMMGTKQLMFGRVKLRTPKIEITENSSYPWHEDLLNCINTLKREVQLYHEGKCAAEPEAAKEAEINFDLESAKQ